MSQQEQAQKIERKTQMQQSYIEIGNRQYEQTTHTTHEHSHHHQSLHCDIQVISLIDSIITFVKQTFLSSKTNFGILVLGVLYLFSNWSITLQNKKGFSIEIVDVVFIILLIIVVRSWLSGEGLSSIFDLISAKTQQVMNLTSQGMNSSGSNQFQSLFRHASSTHNIRKLESAAQLYQRYRQEKFALSEQSFLDLENEAKLTPEAEQQLKEMIAEYQTQFDRDIPFNIKDIDMNNLPSGINNEEDFFTKVLTPHHSNVKDYVRERYGFDYNNQNPMLVSVIATSTKFTNTLPALAKDLAQIEKDLLVNRSLTIYAYGQNKHSLISNRLANFLKEDTAKKIEEYKQKYGGSAASEEQTDQIEIVFGNNGRKEVELQKFVTAPIVERDYDSLEALVLADKLIERQKEVEEEVKEFKKKSKKNMIDGAAQQESTLAKLISVEENNPESAVTESEPEEALKKLDFVLSATIEDLVKKAKYIKYEPKVFETYKDNAIEEQMKCESNSQINAPGRKSITQILSKEVEEVLKAKSSDSLSLNKFVELFTKYEYYADQYKDDAQILTEAEQKFDTYINTTYNASSERKQSRRFKSELNLIKERLLQQYLLRRLKKRLSELETSSNELQHQVTKLTEKSDLKDRKIGLLEEQVESLQNKLNEISERLGTVEIAYEEEKQALIRDVDAKKKKIDELYNQINNITTTASEKEIKVDSPKNAPVITQDEIALRKTTSYNASISILEKSVRSITEVFYDKFRNTAYFNQEDMISKLKEKFGAAILEQGELNQDNRDFIIKQFEDKFIAAEEHFLTKNLGADNADSVTDKSKENQKNILNSLNKNFDILRQRLTKAKDISDIQQIKMSDQDEREANRIVDDIINGALTEPDDIVNRQLISLKKIMLKYKAPVNPRASIDMSQKLKASTKDAPANPHQRTKQKIESTLQYIQENMENIKKQMKNYLSEDMRRTLKSKIAEWKKSQQDKKEVMEKWQLQSQNMWFTLVWHDSNDLDLVVKCPCGQKIYYGTKKCDSCGTYLEIDMNAGGNKNDKYPVEHIYLQKQPKVGSNWEVYCKMFHCNNNKESPYTIQIEHEDGRIVSYQGTLDLNDNPTSPIYKYTVTQGIDEKEKKLIEKIRVVIESQEEFIFF